MKNYSMFLFLFISCIGRLFVCSVQPFSLMTGCLTQILNFNRKRKKLQHPPPPQKKKEEEEEERDDNIEMSFKYMS